jgi:Fe-S cluster assembly ATP-binding protein
MLKIRDLHVEVDGKPILKGLNLDLEKGEVSAVMGPNGSGKSTLSYVLAGKPGYEVVKGEVLYEGKNLLELDCHERAVAGVFLAYQYPVEIPGVSNKIFLKTALNAMNKARGLEELDSYEFLKLLKDRSELVGMDLALSNREVNTGFSGGEKKRNEILQMALLEPKLAILDETDSGLDIDALKAVSVGINALRNEERSMLVITHYQRLLEHIVPDRVHVLLDGRIVKSGGSELAQELEAKGYDWLQGSQVAA